MAARVATGRGGELRVNLLYFDIVGGISGDMTVASLLELGVPIALLREGLRQVGLQGVELATERAQRHNLAGTRFIVREQRGAGHELGAAQTEVTHSHDPGHEHGDDHAHEHGPGHRQGHGHAHDHNHSDAHGSRHPHREYRDIKQMLQSSGLPPGAKEKALAVFAKLALAEGAVHDVPPEEVTFHEVGAWDSIADVVCTALAVDHLRPATVLCSPVPVGCGVVETAHGRMPIPTPATLLLLEGFPIVQGGPAYERTTPTGAAILAALASPAPDTLAYTPRKVGIGIGSMDSPQVPNLLRAVLGERAAGDARRETIECAEANLDDANPEWIGYLMDRLFSCGALDVVLIPAVMKKNRPGTIIQVLYPPAARETVLALLFCEVTTLGVRYRTMERVVLDREHVTVATRWGQVGGVVAHHDGRRRFSPEFDSCRRVAEANGVPLREVYLVAQQVWLADETGPDTGAGRVN